ncbi:MAG: cytochrome-c oxidase, cbb3-type subunit III [Betaproteobacteria bacterium]|nr:cytochrome-c oxidase, cbb3-type subunit III [Betaproteobacteria bacterium]
MSQFTSRFWDFYIAIVVIVSIVGCGVFLRLQSTREVAGSQTQTTGHTWDEDLGEYNNPLPRWWMWLFYITIAFGLAYLALYPGLGSYKGLLGWSEVGQYRDEEQRAAAKYGPIYDRFAKQDIVALAKNPDALAIGQKVFLNNCAQCHASDGGGARGFPNLTDNDWLYGGAPETIEATITNGRGGVMPPWGPVLGDEKVKDVAHYVMSLSGQAHDSIRAARGAEVFKQNCVACHGADGKGNQQIGAPNLIDKTWLYGGSEATIVETITKGRNGHMPAWKDILTPAQIHLVAAYVYSLSHPAGPPATQ